MKKIILIALMFISCSDNTEEEMKLFYQSSQDESLTELNLMIIGTSNAANRNSATETNADFSDLPLDGSIADAYYEDGTGVLKPYTLDMNLHASESGNYGIEYRIAKNMVGTDIDKLNLLKYGDGGSGLYNEWDVAGAATLATISAAKASGKTFTKCIVIGWENDCVDQAKAEAIETKFNALIVKLRSEINSNLEFYVLEMANFTAGTTPYLSTGKTQIQNVVDADSKVHIFKPVWLIPDADNFRDGIHYNVAVTDLIALEAIKEIN